MWYTILINWKKELFYLIEIVLPTVAVIGWHIFKDKSGNVCY